MDREKETLEIEFGGNVMKKRTDLYSDFDSVNCIYGYFGYPKYFLCKHTDCRYRANLL